MHDAYGMLGCVGCGRCGEACLVGIAPIDVFNTLYQAQNEEQFIPKNELELSDENVTARGAGVAVDLYAGTGKNNGRSHTH